MAYSTLLFVVIICMPVVLLAIPSLHTEWMDAFKHGDTQRMAGIEEDVKRNREANEKKMERENAALQKNRQYEKAWRKEKQNKIDDVLGEVFAPTFH